VKQLDGKVAVVTGAGSGIGRALARRLAAEGMRVAGADVDAAGLADTAELVGADGFLGRVVDVADAGQVDALADAVYGTWGQVDLLCNNAGVFVGGYLWDRPAADLEFVLGVNLWGILHGIRSFVPRMIAQGTEGHVVNTSSVAGLFGAPFGGPYAVSKFAAFAATEALANDLAAVGSSIGASVLCPGMIRTEIAASDRNRPEALRTPLTDDQRFVTEYLAGAVAGGMDPAEVAATVVDGVRDGRFLILTHPEYRDELTTRAAALADGQLPGLANFV
jgi:NAD(P)-dependent dehydrogenase (short-subunit alcohol dehydrogenase family)